MQGEIKNNESMIRKILRSEASTIVSISIIIIGIIFWVMNPNQTQEIRMVRIEEQLSQVSKQVTNLKDNDLHTLEVKMDDLQKQIREIRDIVIRLETILEKK